MTYKTRITFEERQKIEKLLNEGFSCSKISAIIGRGRNVVVVEVRRSGGKNGYNAKDAQKMSDERNEFKITSASRKSASYLQTLLPVVAEKVKEGKSFWVIHRELNVSYVTLGRMYKLLNLPSPHAMSLIEKLEDRMYNMEIQLEIIIDKLKVKND